MHKNLNHLSSAEIETLMQRYYSGDKIAILLKEYDISVHASMLCRLFPPKVYPDYKCEYCNQSLVANRGSKTTRGCLQSKSELYCPKCGHRPFKTGCQCPNCLEKERMLRIEQQNQIQAYYSQEREPAFFDDLSFENKVFLGALCQCLLQEDLYEFAPRSGADVVLAPTEDLENKIYDNLLDAQAIAVSPRSTLTAFDLEDDEFPASFYLYKVSYYLNLKFPEDKTDMFNRILDPDYYSNDYMQEALDLWKEIAVAECIEYLLYQLERIKFKFSPGEKTYTTFYIILKDFSVSQVFSIIWRSVADCSRRYLEGNISKKQAANGVIGACERFAERAKLNGWDLTPYSRVKAHHRVPYLSSISTAFLV